MPTTPIRPLACPLVRSYYGALRSFLEAYKSLNADLLSRLDNLLKSPFADDHEATERRRRFCLRYVVRESLFALGAIDTDTAKEWNEESLAKLNALLRRLCEENTMEVVVDKMTGGTRDVLQLLSRDLEKRSSLLTRCCNFLSAASPVWDSYLFGVAFYAVTLETLPSSDARVALFEELVAAGAP